MAAYTPAAIEKTLNGAWWSFTVVTLLASALYNNEGKLQAARIVWGLCVVPGESALQDGVQQPTGAVP